jgi:hypothetical protein
MGNLNRWKFFRHPASTLIAAAVHGEWKYLSSKTLGPSSINSSSTAPMTNGSN